MSRAAVVLVLLAFFLKAAIVPFHAWAPDAYEGASVPVTAYMATIVKAGVLLAIVRAVRHGHGGVADARPAGGVPADLDRRGATWRPCASRRLRRMIAYSSIAHAGYLFYALLGDGAGRFQAVTFYVLAYGVLNVLAFAALPAADDDRERDRLEQPEGPVPSQSVRRARDRHRDAVAGRHTAVPRLRRQVPDLQERASPPGYTTYAVLGLVGSYLGIYFYLRVIQLMFMSPDAPITVEATPMRKLALGASLACLTATMLVAVFPGSVLLHF